MVLKTGVPGWAGMARRKDSTGGKAKITVLPMVPVNTGDTMQGIKKTEIPISVMTGRSTASTGTETVEIPLPAPDTMNLTETIPTGTSVLVPMERSAITVNGKAVITAKFMTETAIPAVLVEMKPHLRRHHGIPGSDNLSIFVNLINHIQSPYK